MALQLLSVCIGSYLSGAVLLWGEACLTCMCCAGAGCAAPVDLVDPGRLTIFEITDRRVLLAALMPAFSTALLCVAH